MVRGFQQAQQKRWEARQILDLASLGLVSGFWEGMEGRAQTVLESPSIYNVANWLSMGLLDLGKGAINPEKPLSLEHWLDSLGFASALYGMYETGKRAMVLRKPISDKRVLHQEYVSPYESDIIINQSTDKPVAAGPSLVEPGQGYNLKEAAAKLKPLEGYTDVVVHGNPDSFGVWHNGSWKYINQRSLATFLKNSPEYNGGPIRLISCSTGARPNGIAQHLSNKLGVRVLAPSDTLYIFSDGDIVIGAKPYKNTGNWKLFIPGQNHTQ